jgi:1,4-dihydroxy-2-naphthoate octaprenyltransferase
MISNFAAGALIVLGVLLTVLGVFAGGSVPFTLIGLGSIAAGGVLGLLDRRLTR